MSASREGLRVLKVAVALAVLGALAWWPAKQLLRPAYRRWRTHQQEVVVGDRTFSYRDLGKGAPVAVIVNGVDCAMDGYLALQQSLATVTRVIAYDRPGLGDSTPSAAPATLDHIVSDMKALLGRLGVPPPYVLVGHSMGGHIIRYYADKHPNDVAALVFLEQPHEDWFRYIRKTWSKQENDDYFPWWSIKEENGRMLERPYYETNCDMVRGMKIDPRVSVLMFTGSNDGHFRKQSPGREADRRAWVDMQAGLIAGLPNAKHVVDLQAGHFYHADRPEQVRREFAQLVQRLRASGVSPR
jgi:pimeloyl-ACP methyl ester carboxylesterase